MDVLKKISEEGYLNTGTCSVSKYLTEKIRVQETFKHDLEEQFKLENHPKANLIFNIANANAEGCKNIYKLYLQLADLCST